MDERTKAMKISDLRARMSRDGYDVDHDAVAEAFVARMLAVHGALRRADVRELLGGETLDELGWSAQNSCS